LDPITDAIVALLELLFDIVTWILQAEERLALLLLDRGVPIGNRIWILCVANSVFIAVEILVLHLLVKASKFMQKIHTPGWLKAITHHKPVTYWDLVLFTFTPGTQKFGVIAYRARIRQFGFRGYLCLILGGMFRVSLYPFLGNLVWGLVILLIAYRAIRWWCNSNNHAKS